MDLKSLQQQLKLAIQNHQILVTKMKTGPKNPTLQKRLSELQTEIMSLSEKQKQVVEQLKKDIEIKQHQSICSLTQHLSQPQSGSNTISTVRTQPTTNQITIAKPSLTESTTSARPQTLTTTAMVATNNSPAQSPAHLAAKLTVTNDRHRPQVQYPVTSAISSSANLTPPTTATTTSVEIPSAVDGGGSKLQLQQPGLSPIQEKTAGEPATISLAPPIRVPQYPPPQNRPAVVTQHQSRKPTTSPPCNRVASSPVGTSEPELPLRSKPKKADLLKFDFMAALGLITYDTLSELQNRKSERKRRTTANPQFSYGNWEHPDKKRKTNNYLTSSVPVKIKRPRGPHLPAAGRPRMGSTTPNNSRPSTPDEWSIQGSPSNYNNHGCRNGSALRKSPDDTCTVCHSGGKLLNCDLCGMAFHGACLDPPLPDPSESSPPQLWMCPKCQMMKKNSVTWPGSLAMVHSYIAHKAAKEEEKRKLIKRSRELQTERNQLEQKVKQLSEALTIHMHKKTELQTTTKDTQDSIEKLKTFIKMFQIS